MSDQSKTIKMLAMLVFVCSASAALSLGMLAFTLATGDLPFGLLPLMSQEPDEAKPDVPGGRAREGEKFAVQLYQQLAAEREKISGEKRAIEDKRRVATEIVNNATELQKGLTQQQTEINGLMVKIDKEEAKNIRSMAKLISDLDPPAAAKMISEMMSTEKAYLVPRIMLFMKSQNAAAILTNIVDKGTKQRIQEMIGVAVDMQKIMEVNP